MKTRTRRWRWTLAPILTGALMLTGCAGKAPQSTVAAYGQAVLDDDPSAAYETLSPQLKAETPYETFLEQWPQLRRSLLDVGGEMTEADGQAARVQAALSYSEYDSVQLRLTDDGWKITKGVLDLYAQKTPREALISFVRAMDHKRFDIIMRFVPSTYAQHMSSEDLERDFTARAAEITELVEALKTNLDNPIHERGNRAFLRYGARELVMVREGDVWKVEDPD